MTENKPPFAEAPDPYSASGPDGEHFSNDCEPPPHQSPPNQTATPEATSDMHTQANRAAPDDDRMMATLTHLSVFLAPILGPLIMFLVFKDTHPRVNLAGRAALNFEISIILWGIAGAILIVIIIGIPLLFAIGIAQFVMPIVAAIATNKGTDYTYPFTLKIL